MKLKFGARLPVSGPLAASGNILAVGQAADDLGFDAITTHDHVSFAYGQRYHNAGGVSELVDEADRKGLPVTNNFETMTTLGVLAGKTRKVRLIPCSIVLPIRHPVLFAKECVSLFELSGGRFVPNVCIGNITSDFDAMNVPYKKRGRITDEYLEVLSLVFSNKKEVAYNGKFVSFPPSGFYPKPSKKMTFWFSGHFLDKVLNRVVKYSDGLLAGTTYPGDVSKWRPVLAQRLKESGRSIDDIELGIQTFLCMAKNTDEAKQTSHHTIESYFHGPEFDKPDPNEPTKTMRDVRMEGVLKSSLVGSPSDVAKKIKAYADVGVTFFDMRLVNRSLDNVLEMMDLFSREVMPSFG